MAGLGSSAGEVFAAPCSILKSLGLILGASGMLQAIRLTEQKHMKTVVFNGFRGPENDCCGLEELLAERGWHT